MTRRSFLERLMTRVSPEPNSGCWLWFGDVDRDGYGRVRRDGHQVGAHRAIYEAMRGEIPDGLVLDHLCRVRCCVNPDHIQPVTNTVNILRGISPPAMNAKKLFCLRGHPLKGDNCRNAAYGRVCRRCDSIRSAASLRRRDPVIRGGHQEPKFWSSEEDAALLDGLKRGLTMIQIAIALGRSRSSTCGRAKRLRDGLARPTDLSRAA